MKKNIVFSTLAIFSLIVNAQDDITSELKNLTDNDQYQKIVNTYSSKSLEYPAKALYYIGQAYYMLDDDNNCIKFMDLSIGKDPNDPAPYYIKASTLNYMHKYEEAINSFKIAIRLKPDDSNFYYGLGYSYNKLEKYEQALESYKKAIEQPNPSMNAFYMLAQAYYNLNDTKNALDAFYVAKLKLSNNSDYYLSALYNIGLMESLNGNSDKAEVAFEELLQKDPNDYQVYAKLIQIYYQRNEYDKAKSYKSKLYEAHKSGLLTGDLNDMFCFDQFMWNKKRIMAFERYEEGDKKDIYNKHMFYVSDQNGNIELRVQTEYSPVSVELGGPKYLLCATRGNKHYNSGIGFNDDFTYLDLKNAVIKIIEDQIKE